MCTNGYIFSKRINKRGPLLKYANGKLWTNLGTTITAFRNFSSLFFVPSAPFFRLRVTKCKKKREREREKKGAGKKVVRGVHEPALSRVAELNRRGGD